jgi:serine/threonine-protein kinase
MSSSSHPLPERFLFRRVLGKGGVGEVLLVRDTQRGEEVALKYVRLAETPTDAVEAEKNGTRLQRELAGEAPHVPQVYEEGEDSEFYYFVMEYVAGQDLSDLLQKGPLAEDRAVHIAVQIFDLLARLHSFTSEIGGRRLFEVIHGDIKPENIRLQEGDRVRVIDFGIAKQLSLTHNYTKNLFGSVSYLPPERLEHGRIDIHSDLWAAAVVLYTMVGGHPPYSATTLEGVERQIRAHQLLPLPETCSRDLRWIINKSLSFDVKRRYSSAAAFRDDLQKLLDKEFLEPAPAPALVTGPSAITQPTRPPVPSPSPETRKTTAPSPPVPPPLPPPPQVQPSPPKQPAIRVRPAPSPTRPAAGTGKMPRALWLILPLLSLLAAGYFLSRDGQQPTPEVQPPLVSEPILEVSSQDRARRLFSQGQEALTEAETLTGARAEEKRAEAQSAFEEAARLDEEWPDPLVGQARALVNGDPPDPQKFEALRKEARRRGSRDSQVFSTVLADAYLEAGKRLLNRAGPAGGPYDKNVLWNSFLNLEQAVSNYEQAGDQGTRYSEARRLKNEVAGIYANL